MDSHIWYHIPAYWCVIDFHVTSVQDTNMLLILRWPYSSILMCYWFSCDLILAYWSFVDSYGTSFHHTNVLLMLMPPHSNILILMKPYSSIIMCDDYQGTSYQDTEVLLIVRWPNSSILMYYCFSCDLIPAYSCVIDFHVTSFQNTEILIDSHVTLF